MPPVQDRGDASSGRICVGRITGAHGLKGELSVRSFTANADDVAAYGPVSVEPGGRQFAIRVVGHKKLDLIVRAEGIADRTAAEALRGCDLFVARTALPPPAQDEFYHADLIGLAAVTDAEPGDDAAEPVGAQDRDAGHSTPPLGRVIAVHEFGAAPVLEIALQGGRTILVPFTREAVPVVDVAAGVVRVASLPGLLEPARA